MPKIIVTFLLLSASKTWAQQMSGGDVFIVYPGLSSSCQTALNTSVSCPIALVALAQSGFYLDQDSFNALCIDSCLSSLQNARSTIAEACTGHSDVVVLDDVAYPATYFADSYLEAYQLSCRKDSSTGLPCDPQLLSWSDSSFNFNESCSDCWLGGLAQKLANPLGYDSGLGSNFASLTSLCGSTQYSFITPTPYALNATGTDVASPTSSVPVPECTGSYTVTSADNCTSLSTTLGVSTYSLLYSNKLDIYCQNWNTVVGTPVCIPPTCNLYRWQPLDTCDSVLLQHTGVTLAQFLAWNPNLNSLCQNSGAFIGYQFCISPPGGSINSTTSSNQASNDMATKAAPVPSNARDGSNRDCGRWYTIQPDDTCGLVSVANSLALDDFYFLNPSLDASCSNLLLGISYCVEPVGDIHIYPHYTLSNTNLPITVPPATFQSVDTTIPTPTSDPGYDYITSQLPVASGTLYDCNAYHNQRVGVDSDCDYIAFAYQIETKQLQQWNPSLSTNLSSCVLTSGYSYCVDVANSGPSPASYCAPVNSSAIMQGTTPDCKCFVLVRGYDDGYYSCQAMKEDYSITSEQLFTWNKWLSPSACDANLYATLATNDERPVCVGIGDEIHPGTTASINPTTATQQMSRSVTSQATTGPTASGVVQGCLRYYTVQAGDGCAKIENAYDVSFFQFHAWNPSIGSDCTNLWLGYAYCVQGPAATTPVQPPAPTQAGLAANCDKYHTVASGDSCPGIESLYGITLDQLYKWNPAIGSNCETMWLGYAVCVGVSSFRATGRVR